MLNFWDLHYFSFSVFIFESMLKLDFAGQAERFLASETWYVHKKTNFEHVPVEWLQFYLARPFLQARLDGTLSNLV